MNIILINAKLLYVHHLLYNNDKIYKLNINIINIIKNINILKILIIHDYHLLFPSNPNPIKSDNLIPLNENIIQTKYIFNIFNKIFFNSNNCYNNYLKYMDVINNHIILTNVPDINYYNNRIFPSKKKIYNIGLIGEISCEHKGRYIANNIIKYINNHNFIIFGNYDIKYDNLIVTGKFDNNNIFELIKSYNIDYFLFVSSFEETYSFTLSIALNTGLPIIYNNIGSYIERLKNYNNCFSFDEDNYYEIKNIIDNMNDTTTMKNIPIKYPDIYNNLAEFSYFSNIKYKFDIKEIINNLNNKCVCFIHLCNLNNGMDIFNDQINYIRTSGLYDNLDYIFVTLLGDYIKIQDDYKIKLIYYSSNPNEMEFPTIQNIKYFSDNINYNVKILYIHTKGVLNKYGSYEWRKYLEYFLIEKHKLCLDLLKMYKCIGVNQQFYFDKINKYRNHFSGNFWWSNSIYIKSLDKLNKNNDRYVVEHWLIGNLEKNDYRFFLSLNHTDNDFYKNILDKEKYNLEIIKGNICQKLESSYVKIRPIYGVYFICCLNNYLNIIKNQLNILVKSELYENTDILLCFVCNETKECIDLLKKYNKIKIISTTENLYERFAINNFKKYIKDNYYIYYIHSKSITRKHQCYTDWTNLCNYFTITKWRLSIELLYYYDSVGTNLKNFPKKHYSGNFWWSKSEHINKLEDIDIQYLSSEMYILSYMKTNYVSIYQSYTNHGNTNYDIKLYNNINDLNLINNICIIPDFNFSDRNCMLTCKSIYSEET